MNANWNIGDSEYIFMEMGKLTRKMTNGHLVVLHIILTKNMQLIQKLCNLYAYILKCLD